METVGVKELRDNLSRILKKVEEGNVVRVMRHGRGVADLRPVGKRAEQEILSRLRDKGISAGGSGSIGTVKSVKNLMPDRPVSDFVAEDRR